MHLYSSAQFCSALFPLPRPSGGRRPDLSASLSIKMGATLATLGRGLAHSRLLCCVFRPKCLKQTGV